MRKKSFALLIFMLGVSICACGSVLFTLIFEDIGSRLLSPGRDPAGEGAQLVSADELAAQGRIAFEQGGAVYELNTDGSDSARTIPGRTIPGGGGCGEPAWSPDGTRLSFICSSSVMVVHAGDSQRINLGEGTDRPRWSPDGDYLAFAHYDNEWAIYTVRTDGTERIRIATYHITGRTFGTDAPYSYDWAPDSTRLIITQPDLVIVKRDGSDAISFPLPRGLGYSTDPAWSPDGERIAFAAVRGDNKDIYLINPDGSNLTRLTTYWEDDSAPRWSPDGERIAFQRSSGSRPEFWDLLVMDADGSNLQRLTSSLYSIVPRGFSWSADGTWLAFDGNKYGDDTTGIFVIAADGSQMARLTETGCCPDWQPER
jgi:TolB protein